MNASQRARRRERRRSAREQARREALAPALDFDAIFSFRALIDSSTTCQRGVTWKGRVQSFTLTRTYQVAMLASELAAGEYRKSPAVHFVLNERGCKRDISGVGFRDFYVSLPKDQERPAKTSKDPRFGPRWATLVTPLSSP